MKATRQRSAPDIVFIVGPTAIGKTRLAVRLAKRIGAEIVSCDSMQAYRGMQMVSQAPSRADMERVRHHLVGVIPPGRPFSVAEFRALATAKIREVCERGKVPLVVGGSGLYAKALIDGLFPASRADLKFRAGMERFVSGRGEIALHKRLEKIDPESARKIHPNDIRRVIRALEIFHTTGKTMTDHIAATRGLKDEYRVKIFGLIRPREELYEEIEKRVESMFKAGVVREVKALMGQRLGKTAKAVLGLSEIGGYLKGGYSRKEAKELLKKHTRHLAKKQLTWFRADKRIVWLDRSQMTDEKIIETICAKAKIDKAKRVRRNTTCHNILNCNEM